MSSNGIGVLALYEGGEMEACRWCDEMVHPDRPHEYCDRALEHYAVCEDEITCMDELHDEEFKS